MTEIVKTEREVPLLGNQTRWLAVAWRDKELLVAQWAHTREEAALKRDLDLERATAPIVETFSGFQIAFSGKGGAIKGLEFPDGSPMAV